MWEIVDGFLVREFSFKNFVDAVNFVDSVVPLAERLDHHPDVLVHSYKKVKIMLKTHSEGKITDKDYELADLIDGLV